MSTVIVFVRLFTTLREQAGKAKEAIELSSNTATVKDVLKELVKKYGPEFRDYLFNEKEKIRDHLQVLVNGKSVSLLEELNTRLKEGDQVAIVPPVGGG